MSRWKPIAFVVAGIVFVALVLVLFIGDWEFMEGIAITSESNYNQIVELLPTARHYSSLNDSAFVFLALGAQANQMNCPAAVESLVRFGGWDGDVYMITDRASCFDAKEIVKNAGMREERFHLTVVDEDFGGGGFDFAHPKVGSRKNRVKSFAMKARLFDIVTDPRIKVLAYVDCDILFAIENCPKEFIQSGPSWKDGRIKFSHLFDDEHGRLVDVHAGTMVAHRDESREVLRIWQAEIEKGDTQGDNDAYMQAYNRYQKAVDNWSPPALVINKNSNHSTGNSSKPSRTVSSAGTDASWAIRPVNLLQPGEAMKPGDHNMQVNWFEKFLEPDNVTVHCMNHIPKARCISYGRDGVQQFVDRFALRTYGDKYPYCTHAALQPLLYGWFPFSYLPFCPKLEQYL